MTLLELSLLLVIGGLCGAVAQSLVGYSHGGCMVSIVLGLIGALLGGWMARALGLGDVLSVTIDGQDFPIVWSIIGAALFVAVLGWMSGRGRG